VKGCSPDEIPVALKDLPDDLRNRIVKHLMDTKGTDSSAVKDGFINIPFPDNGIFHKIPKATLKGYQRDEDRPDTPIKARRAVSKER
jgi:hypothetical protein